MPNPTTVAPDTGTWSNRSHKFTASREFAERDLDLVNALQINPRAPWTRIGPSIGLDATTAARRWNQLTEAGLAWMTAYASELAVLGYAQLRCRPDAVAEVSELVCASPYIYTVDRTVGHHQLELSLAAESYSDLDDFATHWLAELPGVEEQRMAIGLEIYIEGSKWRPQALDHTQRALLTDDYDRIPASVPLRSADRALITALGKDARRSVAELAQDTGLSETAVRRRVTGLMRSGRLRFRCDIANQLAGWPIIVTYRAQLPADRIDALGAALTDWPEIRLCSATADGDSCLLLIAWLRTAKDSLRLESRLLQSFPGLHINERQMTLRPLKRMGRLLNAQGAAIGHVPLDAWSATGP